ncbi:hypothetical protein P261_00878 [Lachnospiraceae bacterium TWA4]|nr:hypothetical protein P261_00878 [Lachnospiraceae bacterium TWA4]
MIQTIQTEDFLKLYQYLQANDLSPIIVKGLVCRNLYPNPDYRMSGDEDLWIPPTDYKKAHELLLAYGMELSDPNSNIEEDYEVPYGKKGSPLYIEVHKSLFPPHSDAYGDFNEYFHSDHTQTISIQGVNITTLTNTDHLFYLICHAFKHFLHSGFGIRQVCDIVLFANTYGQTINWQELLEKCQSIRADQFSAALFKIGQNYLTFDPVKACYPPCWSEIEIDERPLLYDLLDAGIFGDSSATRKHSSNMTLSAVSSTKQGKEKSHGVLASLFPPASALESRYPYVKDKKYLIPIAWLSRLWHYKKETKNSASLTESMKIGNQRIDLLKEYHIIESDKKG